MKNKELLMVDLCMRLPYGVKVKTKDDDDAYMLLSLHPNKNIALIGLLFVDTYATSKVHIDEIKPYLRTMSNMTEEEKEEYHSIQSDIWKPCGTQYYDNWRSIDWLNEHHFDFRGLIPKGLAIEVNESNNPYND